MKDQNLFWPVYKNLENEVIGMTSFIQFDDSQIKTYSPKFVDLLLRISIEIEAIAKQLYFLNGGTPVADESELYFDTVCLKFLEDKWKLSQKEITITGLGFYFVNVENQTYRPLHKAYKRGSSGSNWKKAYQAVKHNRSQNYKSANMINCLQALGALFILNLYLKDDEIYYGSEQNHKEIDLNFDSKIFTPKCGKYLFTVPDGLIRDNFDKYIFIQIYGNNSYNEIIKTAKEDYEARRKYLINSDEFKGFIASHPDYDFSEFGGYEMIAEHIDHNLFQRIIQIPLRFINLYVTLPQRIVLNKGQVVYSLNKIEE